jgi:hypothetical protein
MKGGAPAPLPFDAGIDNLVWHKASSALVAAKTRCILSISWLARQNRDTAWGAQNGVFTPFSV